MKVMIRNKRSKKKNNTKMNFKKQKRTINKILYKFQLMVLKLKNQVFSEDYLQEKIKSKNQLIKNIFKKLTKLNQMIIVTQKLIFQVWKISNFFRVKKNIFGELKLWIYEKGLLSYFFFISFLSLQILLFMIQKFLRL